MFWYKACGVENVSPRVGGGKIMLHHSYPWIAVVKSKMKNGQFLNCAGSIINDRFILTAAHCLQHKLKVVEVYVAAGSHFKPYEVSEYMTAKRWIIHEKFNARLIVNDIGIVELKVPLNFSRTVRPICLPKKGENAKGWGLTKTGASSSVLVRADIQEYSFEKCSKMWNASKRLSSKIQICASSKNISSCSGDSGGPLMQKVNDKIVLAGITSFGNKTISCGLSMNTVYARVEPYLEWINNHTAVGKTCVH
ncbi:Trypsin-1-like protein [Leptotrombidium deliense]|uniref:Trypsin-1-like protein n=1 Tax=Leptotrombidium deliense TaxID=299467 RepID=A0A443S485_9ACAR|nr:Trypsin-1-like protein [Leptotrombidium deliense]